MTLAKSLLTCLSKWVVFSGRASRSELWWFTLVVAWYFAILFLVGYENPYPRLFVALSERLEAVIYETPVNPSVEIRTTITGFVPFLPAFVPWIAAGYRRLHDADQPGWFLPLTIVLVALSLPLLPLAVLLLLVSSPPHAATSWIFWTLFFVCGAAALVAPGFTLAALAAKGTPGPNSYGPEPAE